MPVRYDPQVAPFLRSLPPAAKRNVRKALDHLAKDPVGAPGLDVRVLDLPDNALQHYRLRVGDYRIVYQVHGKAILVLRAFHCRDGYGWLERL